MERRRFLATAGALGAASTAGCAGLFETDENTSGRGGEPPLVANRPDAVYYPTHIEQMEMIGMGSVGDAKVGLMYSYPHRFWTMESAGTQRVNVQESDAVHLMATLWDGDTGTVLSVGGGLTLSITQDGEAVSGKPPWPMISQNMGFHYGDNYALDGDGTYTVTVRPGSVGARKLGAFQGRFEGLEPVDIEFEYEQATRNSIPYKTLDVQGQKGAAELMEMDMMPTSTVPAQGELPGRVIGTGSSGDADIVATVVEDPSFVDASAYLAVSPRTPYNRVPLPLMGLSATVSRNGSAVYDGGLGEALHPDLGYHYGAELDGVQSGDQVTIAVDTPPQVARHEGYEMAFLDMGAVEFTAE
ncbi:hypothetical protein SAMN06269185_0368 [Natronoarchaeum philippinense]|uniref:DUF7350 domain-containing protein n=1 Tax=Natronoarchaeum philippinense TaxID=558529 RepID=A0A285N2X9_NATPI|nr:hypothetical protein [Natronoarchaeum philippinense]SNZ03780.1 hypothetical protein SAMN06269185_0368 [Natronoarchaeum philippinense]